MHIARTLSFSRRRRTETSKHGKPPSPPTTTSEADTESSDGSSGPASRRLQPLRSLLTKKHSSKMSGSAKRWFEIDDNLGVLYQFLGREELEKRRACPAPAHKAHTPRFTHTRRTLARACTGRPAPNTT